MPVVSHSQGATSVLLNVGRFPFKLDFAHRRCDVPVSENRRDSLGSLGEDVIMAVASLGHERVQAHGTLFCQSV